MRRYAFHIVAVLIAIAIATALWLVVGRPPPTGCLPILLDWYQEGLRLVQAAPAEWFWLGLTAMPLFGLPVAPLFVAAGLRFSPATAIAMAATSMLVNLLLSHYIASRWLRVLLAKLLVRLGYRELRIPEGQHRQAVLLLRITPGIPVAVGNYLLPVAGVGLGDFLVISFPIQLGFACGFVMLGRSLSGGGIRWALLAVAVLILLKLLLRRQARAKKIE